MSINVWTVEVLSVPERVGDVKIDDLFEPLQPLPLYFECNQKSWDSLKTFPITWLEPPKEINDFYMNGVQIRVVPDREDGFHPVYKLNAAK